MAGERERARGFFDRMKGKAKRIAGEVTGDPRKRAEGSLEKAKGTYEEKKGEAKERISKKIDET